MNESPFEQTDPSVEDNRPATSAASSGINCVTYAVIAICVVVFAFFNIATEASFFDSIASTLAPSSIDVWTGAYWGLITTAFVHIGIWHVAFNMWWAKDFGAVLEPTMGRGKYFIFILTAAAVSSGAQLAFSDQTGIGFSGVVYAMFGYGLAARNAEPRYRRMLDSNTIKWLLGWLVLCIVLTFIEVWKVGNYAHVAGFLFGYFTGNAFIARTFVPANIFGLALLVIISVLSLFYVPWSDAWQMRGEIAEYLAAAERADSGDAEAQYQFAYVNLAVEDKAECILWLRKSIDQGYVPAMNGLAWILATDPEASFRDGAEAVKLARQACESDDWKTPAYIDTLAAAYAEQEEWDEAMATQRLGIEKLGEDHEAKASYDSRLQQYLKREKVRD